MDLSIIIPSQNDAARLAQLLPRLAVLANRHKWAYEILVVEHEPNVATRELLKTQAATVKLIEAQQRGYGWALRAGFERARGKYLVTMAADLSDDPAFIPSLWNARERGEMIIGSRYAPGAKAEMPPLRWLLSRLMNGIVRRVLSLPVHDLSSGFRLYQANILRALALTSGGYDILEEVLIKAYAEGWRLREVPRHYQAGDQFRALGRRLQLGSATVRTLLKMWRLRNSVDCADYDYRAHNSLIPLQRFWQRRRHQLVLNMVDWSGTTLDIGCGSSHILADLTSVVGLDIRLNKLRFDRNFNQPILQGSIWSLPFPDHSFECVLCSEVIEHIPAGDLPFLEMRRVLKPGGRLVLGTPDYGHRTWRIIEAAYGLAAPGGYAVEHITHYTQSSLAGLIKSLGFRIDRIAYVLHSDMIMECTYLPEVAARTASPNRELDPAPAVLARRSG